MAAPRREDQYTQIPPHDLGMERAVLGACLLDPQALAKATTRLVAPDFFLEAHRVIWKQMLELREAGTGVDTLTLVDALREAGDLEIAGGPAHLALCEVEGAVAAYVDDYCQSLLRHSAKRGHIQVLEAAITQSRNGADPAALALEVGEHLQRIAERIEPGGRRGGLQRLGRVLGDVVAQLDQAETDFVPTPIPELSQRLGGGLLRGELAYLGGRPGAAKTALALQWALLAAQATADRPACPTLVVSREMKNAALGRRVLAQQAQVSATALRQRRVSEADRRSIERNLPRLAALPVWFDDGAETLAQIRRAVRQVAPRFVIVDYLQLVRDPEAAKMGRRLEVTAISAGLKRIAMRFDCSVLAMSSLRRPIVHGQAPEKEDLKESGDMEADADAILLLWQPKADRRDRELIFAKLREGETGGRVTLDWTPTYVRFTEVPSAEPDEPGADDVPF